MVREPKYGWTLCMVNENITLIFKKKIFKQTIFGLKSKLWNEINHIKDQIF